MMKRVKRMVLPVTLWTAAAILMSRPLFAQQASPSSGPVPAAGTSSVSPGFGRGVGEAGPFSPGMQERLEKGRQNERQKRLVADTDHLLALATQLKADMEKTTKDTMSIDVIKKAEEIEKLAKSVKDRMRG